jgi:hypothetical protein
MSELAGDCPTSQSDRQTLTPFHHHPVGLCFANLALPGTYYCQTLKRVLNPENRRRYNTNRKKYGSTLSRPNNQYDKVW